MTHETEPHRALARVVATLGSDPFVRRSLGLLGLLTVAAALYSAVPLSGYPLTAYYTAISAGSMLIALRGVLHHRPMRSQGWLLVLGGFGCWVVADLVAPIEQHMWHDEVYPVPSDALYLAGYVVLAAGALGMVRTRRAGRDMTALLDALIIATGAAVVASVFVIAPLASDSEMTNFAKIVSSGYPIGDVLLIAVIVRMWAAPGAQTASYRLLLSAVGLTTAGDVIWNAEVIVTGSLVNPWADVLWLGSYVMVAAAACLPSMTALAELAPEREDAGSQRRRVIVLACGIMLPAATLLIDGVTGGGVLWHVIGVGALLISLLVLMRMAKILATVEIQAVQLAALARSDALTGAPNRRTWDYELSRACAQSLEHGTPLSVAMMDIDHFKAYNDTHGHQAGDRLLREAVASWTEQLGSAVFARPLRRRGVRSPPSRPHCVGSPCPYRRPARCHPARTDLLGRSEHVGHSHRNLLMPSRAPTWRSTKPSGLAATGFSARWASPSTRPGHPRCPRSALCCSRSSTSSRARSPGTRR